MLLATLGRAHTSAAPPFHQRSVQSLPDRAKSPVTEKEVAGRLPLEVRRESEIAFAWCYSRLLFCYALSLELY